MTYFLGRPPRCLSCPAVLPWLKMQLQHDRDASSAQIIPTENPCPTGRYRLFEIEDVGRVRAAAG